MKEDQRVSTSVRVEGCCILSVIPSWHIILMWDHHYILEGLVLHIHSSTKVHNLIHVGLDLLSTNLDAIAKKSTNAPFNAPYFHQCHEVSHMLMSHSTSSHQCSSTPGRLLMPSLWILFQTQSTPCYSCCFHDVYFENLLWAKVDSLEAQICHTTLQLMITVLYRLLLKRKNFFSLFHRVTQIILWKYFL